MLINVGDFALLANWAHTLTSRIKMHQKNKN
jgi:hypothetical protein